MKPLVTILYEDSIRRDGGGDYPLHDFVLRLVEDEVGGETWRLKKIVKPVPRNGVDGVLKDVRARTALFAGAGKLFLLIDRDRIAQHLKLDAKASEASVIEKVNASSDAPDKLEIFFLQPNVEGLLRSMRECDPGLVAANVFEAALHKKLIQRDLVFAAAKKAAWTGRPCVRNAQPGIDALAKAIAAYLPAAVTP